MIWYSTCSRYFLGGVRMLWFLLLLRKSFVYCKMWWIHQFFVLSPRNRTLIHNIWIGIVDSDRVVMCLNSCLISCSARHQLWICYLPCSSLWEPSSLLCRYVQTSFVCGIKGRIKIPQQGVWVHYKTYIVSKLQISNGLSVHVLSNIHLCTIHTNNYTRSLYGEHLIPSPVFQWWAEKTCQKVCHYCNFFSSKFGAPFNTFVDRCCFILIRKSR